MFSITLYFVLSFLVGAKAQECPELVSLTEPPLIVFSEPFPISGLTVTNFNAEWFESGGISFFNVTIHSSLVEPAKQNRLKLRVLITGRVKGSQRVPKVLVDAVYQVRPSTLGRPVGSEEIFDLPELGEGVFVSQNSLDDFNDNQGRLLPIELNAVLKLSCNDQIQNNDWQENISLGEIGGFDGIIDPSLQNIDAISPGSSDPTNPGLLQEERPTFYFNSALSSGDIVYSAGETKFIVYLAEVLEGQNPIDAIENTTVPFITIREDENTSQAFYPYEKPTLREGVLYAWKISMRLRGPVDRWVPSRPLFFRFTRNPNVITPNPFSSGKEVENFISVGDDYTQRLLAALKIILEENYEVFITSLGSRIPVKGQIRWNGQPYSLEQLEKLAHTFSRKDNSLTRMRFRQ